MQASIWMILSEELLAGLAISSFGIGNETKFTTKWRFLSVDMSTRYTQLPETLLWARRSPLVPLTGDAIETK